MAKLTASEVKQIATLAKLSLSENEVKKFQVQLSEVLDYFGQLKEVDTENTLPTSQTTGITNSEREDSAKESLAVKAVLSGTDKTYNNYFVVDALIKKNG